LQNDFLQCSLLVRILMLLHSQVMYFEVVDQMVRQLVARLSAAKEAGEATRFTVVVTGDHSTPAVFGDHSHEPVPFAVAAVE